MNWGASHDARCLLGMRRWRRLIGPPSGRARTFWSGVVYDGCRAPILNASVGWGYTPSRLPRADHIRQGQTLFSDRKRWRARRLVVALLPRGNALPSTCRYLRWSGRAVGILAFAILPSRSSTICARKGFYSRKGKRVVGTAHGGAIFSPAQKERAARRPL